MMKSFEALRTQPPNLDSKSFKKRERSVVELIYDASAHFSPTFLKAMTSKYVCVTMRVVTSNARHLIGHVITEKDPNAFLNVGP
jgi:hypothetical protein